MKKKPIPGFRITSYAHARKAALDRSLPLALPLTIVSRPPSGDGELSIHCRNGEELIRELRFARDIGLFKTGNVFLVST